MNKNNKRHLAVLPGVGIGVKVLPSKRFPKGDISMALRKLKREVKDSGKMQEFKDRRFFVSKKVKQRKQKEAVVYAQRMQLLNEE